MTAGLPSGLVFIGATHSRSKEIDTGLATAIRERASADGLADRVFFVESTLAIEKYFRAVDVYVLPSIREGLPIALLEAMSTGLPCVASRLPGSTDVVIEHGVNGRLVMPDDIEAVAAEVATLLENHELAARLGAAARETIVARYSIQRTAAAWQAAYEAAAGSRVAVDPEPSK